MKEQKYKILLVINKSDRELHRMSRIENAIRNINPCTEIKKLEWNSLGFTKEAIAYRPDAILTFPLTPKGISGPFYIIKAISGCLLVTYRTEGFMAFDNPQDEAYQVGMDKYGPDLVDLEIFWGSMPAKHIGEGLVNRNRLSDINRALVAGAVEFEAYTTLYKEEINPYPLSPEGMTQINSFSASKIVLFLMGWPSADYTKEDIKKAGDISPDILTWFVTQQKGVRQLRTLYIDQILKIAKTIPDALFIVKRHPRALSGPYKRLKGKANILYIDEPIPVSTLIPNIGLLVHYGSTAQIDAKLCNVPTVHFSSSRLDEEFGFPLSSNSGWDATLNCDVDELDSIIQKHFETPLKAELTLKDKKQMKIAFNWIDSSSYTPSRNLAEVLMNKSKRQKVKIISKNFIRSIALFACRGVKQYFKVKNTINTLVAFCLLGFY